MNVGLFGGSFNPPHLAHLIVAETIRDQFGLDRVLWIPGRLPPHKASAGLAPVERRMEMVQLATAGHDAFAVSDIEVRREGLSYTIDTIRALQEAHPDNAFHLMLGGDSLAQLGSWRAPEEIVRRVPLIVYRRPGAPASTAPVPQARVHFADAPLLEISAEAIRARRRAGRSIRYLVPPAVLAYIETHRLYAPPSGS